MYIRLIVSMLVLIVSTYGQLTVDATGPIRSRTREATRGHGGGVGRKLPLEVRIRINGAPPDENGKTMVEFLLKNTGKSDLMLPISPHPRDLEPSDQKAPYAVLVLGLRISLSKEPGVVFSGGADLYGDAAVAGSTTTLAPGSSVLVLTMIALPQGVAEQNEAGFIATAILNKQTMRRVNGQVFSDMDEIGSARSAEYTMSSLLRSSE